MSNKDMDKITKILKMIIDKKKLDVEKYIFMVPLKVYEEYLEHYEYSDDSSPFIYIYGVRLMWSKKINKAKLITKKCYNKKYNPCSFVEVV